MFKYANVTVGADPEVFFLDKDGNPFPAIGLVGGTKEKPLPIPGLEGCAVQEDNVAAEFNIPPATSSTEFDESIFKSLEYISSIALKNGHRVAFKDSFEFAPEHLKSKAAMTLGCEPDFNVWELRVNPRPNPPKALRTAAGHVHIGYAKPTEESKIILGRACDLFIGVPSILVTPKTARRTLYGKAGAVRLKDYGIEYRVPSNWWLETAELRRAMFNKVHQTVYALMDGKGLLYDSILDHQDVIVDCINNHDKDVAIRLMDTFDVAPFPG